MTRILIADDHALMREGLKQLFALTEGPSVVAEASTGAEVLDQLRATPVDLILLDMSMPGISGMNLIARIRAQRESLPILVLTMHSEVQIAQRALDAGASGYITKDCDPQTLIAAIRKVAAGGRFLDPGLAQQMLFSPTRAAQPHQRLTNREFDIFNLLVRGRSVNEIADRLFISNKTVSTHKARLMQKLECQNSVQLIRYAISHGLVE
jgi:DNA-binding NarL/FixJ family response regulator